jgi:hypothetical protein
MQSISSGDRRDRVWNVVMKKPVGIKQVIAGRGTATCSGGLPIRSVKNVLESRLYSFFYATQFSHKRGGSYFIDEKNIGGSLGFAGWFTHKDSKNNEYELICVRVVEGSKVHLYLMKFSSLLKTNQDLSESVLDHVEIDASQHGTIRSIHANSVFYQEVHHLLLLTQRTAGDRILERYAFSLSTEEQPQDDGEIKVIFKLEYEVSESSFSGLYQMVDGQIFRRDKGEFFASEGNEPPDVSAQADINASPHHNISIKFTLSAATLVDAPWFETTLFQAYPDEREIYNNDSPVNNYLSAFSQKIEYKFFYNGNIITEDSFEQTVATYNNDVDNWQEVLRRVHDYNCTTHPNTSNTKNFYSSEFDLQDIGGDAAYLINRKLIGSGHPASLNTSLVTSGTNSKSMPTSGITEFPYTWSIDPLIKRECVGDKLNKESISPIARLCCIFAPRKEGEAEFKTLYVLLNDDFFEKKTAYEDAKKELADEEKDSPNIPLLKQKVAEKKTELEESYSVKINTLTEESDVFTLVYQIDGFGRTYISGL